MTNSTLFGNEAISGNGGGIYNGNDSTLTMTSSTIYGNNASIQHSGGGIFNNDNGILIMTNSIIGNNVIGGDYAGSPLVCNMTINLLLL
jgi:hypothetical protein